MPQHSFKVASQKDLESLGIRKIKYTDKTRGDSLPRNRLEATRQAGEDFRDYVLGLNKLVNYYRTFELMRVPFPTKYGLLNATRVTSPLMHLLSRVFILQIETTEGLKTLLFTPSDIDANKETPFFRRFTHHYGPISGVIDKFVTPIAHRVEDALRLCGITPEDVDFISYDHLHMQDLRKWLGNETTPGYFPNARLLIMKQEWFTALGPLPPQADWYCPNGLSGIPADRVMLLDSSVMIGDCVALLQTPGHTEGNLSMVAHTPEGLMVSSKNGIAADSYSPWNSKIPGVKAYASDTGAEVILNANAMEKGVDQYISMVFEKTIAGPSRRNTTFYNIVPTAELTEYWGFPGLKPTFSLGELEFGTAVSYRKAPD